MVSWIGMVICALVGVGGSLFGYDIGVISGVLVMDDFVQEFQLSARLWKTAAVVSTFVVGNLLGAMGSTFLANWIGRRFTLAVGSLIFLVGGVAQTFAFNFYVLLAGRVVAGYGIGLLTMVVPLLISEYAPRKWRALRLCRAGSSRLGWQRVTGRWSSLASYDDADVQHTGQGQGRCADGSSRGQEQLWTMQMARAGEAGTRAHHK